MTGCGSPGRYARRNGPLMRSMRTLDVYSTSAMNSSLPCLLAMETPRRLGSLHGESAPINHWLTAPYRTSSTTTPLRLDSSFSRTQIILTTSPPLDDDAEKTLVQVLRRRTARFWWRASLFFPSLGFALARMQVRSSW